MIGSKSNIKKLLFSSNGWPNSSQIVDISSNDSNGMIQASFFQLARNLTKLNVSNNSFTGPIPSLPCINSPFVMLLDFSSNNHNGQIQWTKRMFQTTGFPRRF